MRKKNQEITDKNILEEILAGSKICRLAMMDGNRPYIVPFNYGYKDGYIYIHSALEGKKLELLRQNNKVCFEVEQVAEIITYPVACRWETAYCSVIGYGEVEIVTDFDDKENGLKVIMAHNGFVGEATFEKKSVDLMVILKLRITEITGKQSKKWDQFHKSQQYERI
jgi:nitroimidazol reductase NimA-like FMN-containing flavoprotein (pyridoxamine 5'-phosphate oxidase superfamily)